MSDAPRVRSREGQSLGGAQVNFIEGKEETTVYADTAGHYKAKLRPGAYTMHILYGVGPTDLWYERPLFEIGRPNRHVAFDVRIGGSVALKLRIRRYLRHSLP